MTIVTIDCAVTPLIAQRHESRSDELARQALAFHHAHPEVWSYFVEFAMDRAQRGFRHYSADAIMHRVRWETNAGAGDGFKINNNHIAFYARRFMQQHPQFDGFFRTRRR